MEDVDIEKLRARDEGAINDLCILLLPRIRAYLRRMGGLDSETVDDVTQEVLLAFFSKLDRITAANDPQAIFSWVFAIARNYAHTYHRKRKRFREIRATDELRATDESQVDKAALEQVLPSLDNELLIRRALTQLSAEDRRLIELRLFEEKTTDDIAKELAIPVSAARFRMYRVTQKLRDALVHGETSGRGL